jgi:phospholipase/carboxylesterase
MLPGRSTMDPDLLHTVEHETGEPVRASVIWLHGLGADGHDFEPIVPELSAIGAPVRFVFPHAPVRPVTLNGGIPMRAWFDVYSLERGRKQDEDGIRSAQAQVEALIRRENERGVPTGRIVLAGFSQGGAIALHTGVRYAERLAGLIGLSTYLPLDWMLPAEAHDSNRSTPVFMAHGSFDPLVPPDLGDGTRGLLQERGYDVEWHTYPIAHGVCAEEVADVATWMSRLDLAASRSGQA